MQSSNKNSSFSKESRYRLPKVPSLNHSTLANSSPSNSFYLSFSQAPSAVIAEKVRIPKLNTKPLPYQSKRGIVERNPVDGEFLMDYKKCEIKRSRKISDEKFPFWFVDAFGMFEYSTGKDDFLFDQINHIDRSGFLSWCEDLREKTD